MKTNFEFETSMEFDVHVEVEGFVPERPAPACSNPDDPRYSDSGDPAEWDKYTAYFVFTQNGKKIRIEFPDDLYEIMGDNLEELITSHDFFDKSIPEKCY